MKIAFSGMALISVLCVGAAAQEKGSVPAPPTTRAVATPNPLLPELWASPRELRDKKFIGCGLFGTNGGNGGETAVTSRFLAKHPDFVASFPYDGYVLPAVVDAEQSEKLGLPRRDYFLHELVWNTVKLSDESIAPAIADLKSVRWGSVTDNFLNYSMTDGARGRFTPDLASDRDWAILEHHAAMAARLCREAKLQGFWLDTEQYGAYRWRTASGVPEFEPDKPKGIPFPLGKDTPELLRRRGAQWIKAVQAELPAVKIIIVFAWSPDANEYGPLKGSTAFLNGVLDAIEKPAQLIHGYENTFYYGQGPGTTHASNDGKKDGFPGGRDKFAAARSAMKEWRAFSSNPAKYDAFLKVGMAAWVEDHPWNVPDGWPNGTKASLWSNLPLALAYSDEYVWVWSEHTKYCQPDKTEVNPFLASLSNQTFNTGREAVATLAEDFASDPLRRGWYFDFDMLAIGRKKDPTHEAALMSPDAVPYRWSKDAKAVQIEGAWMTGPNGDVVADMGRQRRRYVHPIQPLSGKQSFQADLDFRVDRFGSDPANPILLGLFNNDRQVNCQSITMRIDSSDAVFVTVAGDGRPWVSRLNLAGGLIASRTYRVSFTYRHQDGRFDAVLTDTRDSAVIAQVGGVVPEGTGQYNFDEMGAAMWDADPISMPPEKAYRYRLERVTLHTK
jgi:hypothetical protein